MEEVVTRTVGIHKAVPAESAKELSAGIDRPAAQRQPPEETISQGNRRVEVGSRVSSNVYSEYHGCRPSEDANTGVSCVIWTRRQDTEISVALPQTNCEPVSVLVVAEIL